ncbi:MAG: hypothetical protein WBO45_12970 [Planctomycetota bacterium]
MAQGQGTPPPQARYSTHDFTLPVLPVPPEDPGANFQEWMVDVKTPGDGFTYSAGTITVNRTQPVPTLFSNFAAFPPAPGFEFNAGAGPGGFPLNQRQIGILQINNAAQGIQNQRYFHGATAVGGEPNFERATNVRGIAVWPTGVPGTTRVAICGETYDQVLPSNALGGWALATATDSSGFIAVFDGAANLQWTHHFFGGNAGSSAVTDLCIRVDAAGNETVTYCGISSHGNPTPNGTLNNLAPFPVVPPAAGGATDNGAGQWDGFVGRLVRTAAGVTNPVFHSVVGGIQQDGLFGIAELDTNRFVAVGSTGITGAPSVGAATFPLTSIPLLGIPGPYAIGVLMVFDASTVVGPAPFLTLESGTNLGDPNRGMNTVARDVVAQPGYNGGSGLAVVVGSTDDANLLVTIPVATQGPQALFGGGVDGFIVAAWMPPANPPFFVATTFRGTAADEELTGVNAWSEFTDHFVVTGRGPGAGVTDIEVASYVIDTNPLGYWPAPLVALTATTFGGAGFDGPTAIGATNATTLAGFGAFGIGDPAGGGIAVDQTGRVNVVGTTDSNDFGATTAAPINYVFAAGRNKTGFGLIPTNDGTRTVLDMLPAVAIQPGIPTPGAVGRTDGTGQLPTGNALGVPTYPLVGVFGGSTPECALLPFGFQVGVAPPLGFLRRMLIDYEGPVPASGLPMTLVVSRPPGSFGELSAWQIGFPGVPAPPAFLPGGALIWITGPSVTFAHFSSDATLRFPIALPLGNATISVQLVALPSGLVGGTPAGGPPPCTTNSGYVATPAMWLTY